MVKGEKIAFWTPENRFTTNESPPIVTIVSYSHAGSVRARLSACPAGLQGCRPEGRPFTLHLPTGQVTLRFPESARPVTLDLQREPWHPFFLIFLGLLGSALALLFPHFEERALLGAVLTTSGLYFSQTAGQIRGLDVAGHIAHVQKIASDGLFVNAQACWECFHPPLYYALSSLLLGIPTMIHPWGASLLQGFTLLLHCLAVPIVLRALRPFAADRRALLLFSALVLLWPAAVLASVRLGNDSLLNLCAFGVILLLLEQRLLAAAMLAAGAMLVKESALTLVAMVATWGAVAPFRPRMRLGAGFLLAGGLALSRWVEFLKHFNPARMEALAPDLRLQNTWANVALPDLAAFLRQPFVNPWFPSSNREHLINYFWKSSLFGEWKYAFPLASWMAQALSAILLVMLAIAARSWWRAGRPFFPALLLLLSFAAVMGYRLLHPFASNPDFRFVYPFTAMGLALCLTQGKAREAKGTAFTFLLLSEFIFLLHWWFEA